MSRPPRSPQDELDHCVARETSERAAALASTDPSVRSCHLIMADRYADRACWLSETYGLSYVPPGKVKMLFGRKRAHGQEGDYARMGTTAE